MSIIEFWPGFYESINMKKLLMKAIPVKGKIYSNPCRFIEIYGNINLKKSNLHNKTQMQFDQSILREYFPIIPGLSIQIAENIYQPPFTWKDCSQESLAINFTYNTNAFYRIFDNMEKKQIIRKKDIPKLIDKACIILSQIYISHEYRIIKSINNNINMFLISKVVEKILGKNNYNSIYQEVDLTLKTLKLTIENIKNHLNLTIKEQMGLALGKGIVFFKHFIINKIDKIDKSIEYIDKKFAIDHRDKLIAIVEKSNIAGKKIFLCAILDDTAESVEDLLWMQKMIERYPYFNINLLVNKAQISINFSSSMMNYILKSEYFNIIAKKLNKQFFIYDIFCPLISYQTNFLEKYANFIIDNSDLLYIKGLNFFETLQIQHKDTFYSFVVFGPISILYTGLNNYDAVFAFIPKDDFGYIHNANKKKIRTLIQQIKGGK